ncbi:MAG TPA: 2-amino-4-hydroxy-6-hydroxymethyldihydropteridine diphosphokinase [bacterium]|nr:2-amino-4-hydroxy-6-hydroxymethyldihydropteridine diphosphokinase [bacterium]HOL34633.1 2-amino-4-hydroxy-6-hydroxymethyldihydropteridine diphosphokinase [bacterium]HPP08179.1 2-amino-4-hydroxy-6-hydroxymethyldihydropteridine diphosphokinase [bacterium]
MAEVFIALGSNLGDRKRNILNAVEKIKEKVKIIRISSIYRTQPQEGVAGKWFLNGVLNGQTHLSPEQLLRFLQSIEENMGRPKNHKKNLARTIDLDILFYDNCIIKKRHLRIPHPGISTRDFVLKGLLEIAPDLEHPETKTTIRQMWKEIKNGNSKNKVPYQEHCSGSKEKG